MKILRIILSPIGIVYWLATSFRNYLYDIGYQRGLKFDLKTICVGNLSVGGSGKTPHAEFLIDYFKSKKNIVLLSRGYKRATRGFLLAQENTSVEELGDESFQVYSKYKDAINVAVCEDRAFGISMLAGELPETNLVLLDDGFQHRGVAYNWSVMISDFNKPFFEDLILPIGDLREARRGAKRANQIVFSKCPEDIDGISLQKYRELTKKYSDATVYFSKLKYSDPINYNGEKLIADDQVVLVTGIAKAMYFKQYLSQDFKVIKHFNFADHHKFSDQDIKMMLDYMSKFPNSKMVCTEKDWVKLKEFTKLKSVSCNVVPIQVCFLEDEHKFLSELESNV